MKIEAAVSNARAFLKVREEFSLDAICCKKENVIDEGHSSHSLRKSNTEFADG